jgi:hypothetical protein
MGKREGGEQPRVLEIWPMFCKSCLSENQRAFSAEVAIHFPGLKGLDKPTVFVFAKFLVCLDCGFAQFVIPETELRRLAEAENGTSAA